MQKSEGRSSSGKPSEPERLVIPKDWKEAAKDFVSTPRPPGGYPKPEQGRDKKRGGA